MSERTLVLIKPDGVRRGLAGEVLSRIERKGLQIVAMDMRVVAKDLAETHYAEHAEKPFYGALVEFITSGPLVALVGRPGQGWALVAGTVLQVAMIATGVVVPAMYGLGVIFGALWLTAIWLGRRYEVP